MKFSVLAKCFEFLEGTSSRLEMTDILANLFKDCTTEEIDKVVYMLQGTVAPPFRGIEIGMGEKFVQQAVSNASGVPKEEVVKQYKTLGDLGDVASNILPKKEGVLTVSQVYDAFMKIATASGKGTQEVRINALTELLKNSSPEEAKYLVRIPLGKLRLGVGDATIIDALSVRTVGDKSMREEIERAYNLCCDMGLVAKTLYTDREAITNFQIKVGNPIKPALAERLSSAEEIIEKIGECYVEAKYDGFRIQLHKEGDKIELFSRRIERMTHMFPEIVQAAKEQIKGDAIIEGETISYDESTGEFLPFQFTIRRKRKHGVEEMAEQYPAIYFAFDILYNGKDLTQKPYLERRNILEQTITEGEIIKISEKIRTGDPQELMRFFNENIGRGLEGIVAKDLNAPYIAGARKFAWIKLKRSYKGELADTVDVTIVGYLAGRGSRAKMVGALLGAVYDEETETFKTVAKIGSGMTEEQMINLKKMLDQIKVEKKPKNVDSLITPDVWTQPQYVITVSADEITLSPSHTCGRTKDLGYALRFPRMISWIRQDKKPEDSTTVKEIIQMYNIQKHAKTE
ncbi:MAG: ATP-dependent DNA ligase [Candidatus Freyarchaeota archaeon]|nr:ATP-dependent DNA ligase [Candidatus Jordarchaeia archaeon]MBS7267308.1 ATP-dependent DNA ligase [Candidatus Jordarchaeia archaeon]MBS7278260.1 ATP-dependent DNA ligase [Candidatus Jordarchaeia archaeon]